MVGWMERGWMAPSKEEKNKGGRVGIKTQRAAKEGKPQREAPKGMGNCPLKFNVHKLKRIPGYHTAKKK